MLFRFIVALFIRAGLKPSPNSRLSHPEYKPVIKPVIAHKKVTGKPFIIEISLVLYLFNLYGRYIEQTQNPITDYTYNGYLEKRHYKSSNQIYITYNSKQYTLHTGDRILDKIKAGEIPKLYYSSKTDYLFFEDDYLPIGYAQAALLFTIIFPTIGIIVWRKELDNDIRTM